MSIWGGMEERIAGLEKAIQIEQLRNAASRDKQRAVNEALANLIDDLSDNEPTRAEKATLAALREALK